jgi:hypothetical protein
MPYCGELSSRLFNGCQVAESRRHYANSDVFKVEKLSKMVGLVEAAGAVDRD